MAKTERSFSDMEQTVSQNRLNCISTIAAGVASRPRIITSPISIRGDEDRSDRDIAREAVAIYEEIVKISFDRR